MVAIKGAIKSWEASSGLYLDAESCMLFHVRLRQTQEDHWSRHQHLHQSSALVFVLQHVLHVARSCLPNAEEF